MLVWNIVRNHSPLCYSWTRLAPPGGDDALFRRGPLCSASILSHLLQFKVRWSTSYWRLGSTRINFHSNSIPHILKEPNLTRTWNLILVLRFIRGLPDWPIYVLRQLNNHWKRFAEWSVKLPWPSFTWLDKLPSEWIEGVIHFGWFRNCWLNWTALIYWPGEQRVNELGGFQCSLWLKPPMVLLIIMEWMFWNKDPLHWQKTIVESVEVLE